MAAVVEVDGRKPGKVRNREIIAKTRAVVTKFDPPDTWDDLTTDGFTEDLIDRYEVTLRRAGVDIETQSGKGTRYVWPMTKAEAALTGYGFRAKAIIEDLEAGEEDPATGSVTPEGISIGTADIEDGAVTYAKIVTQIGSIRIGSSAPSPAKDGDVWYDTNFSPPRLKRYNGSSWVELINGPDLSANSVTADKMSVASLSAISANIGTVTAGSITGVTITGGTIRTANSGAYIELSSANTDRIRFIFSGSEAGRILSTSTTTLTLEAASALNISIGGSTKLNVNSGGVNLIGAGSVLDFGNDVNNPGVVHNTSTGTQLLPTGAGGGTRPASWIPVEIDGATHYLPAFKTTDGGT